MWLKQPQQPLVPINIGGSKLAQGAPPGPQDAGAPKDEIRKKRSDQGPTSGHCQDADATKVADAPQWPGNGSGTR
jgi:hypothetical protein